MENTPIDHLVTTLTEACADNSKGFTLSLAKDLDAGGGDHLTVTVAEAPKPPPLVAEYLQPISLRTHTLYDTQSLIDFAKKYGDPADSLIVVGDDKITLSLNEIDDRGDRELITLDFERHPDFKAWTGIMSAPQQHRTLLKAMIAVAHTINDPAILNAMRTVRATATVKFDSDLRESGDTVGVQFSSSAGEDLIKFPKSFVLDLPVLADDSDDESSVEYIHPEIRLEVQMPSRADEPVLFVLTCPEWRALYRKRIKTEVDILRAALTNWTIVRGVHEQADRTIENKQIVHAPG